MILSGKRKEESRVGGRGGKAATTGTLKEDKANRKRSRDEDKEKKLDVMISQVSEKLKKIEKNRVL